MADIGQEGEETKNPLASVRRGLAKRRTV